MRINISKLYEKTWRKAIFKPIVDYKPPVPKIVLNPKLKKEIARAKIRVLPMETEGGKILSYPKVVNPIIEVSPFFKTLTKQEKEMVLEHELMHIIHAQAFPGRRQIHREGSLLGMENIMLKWKGRKPRKKR